MRDKAFSSCRWRRAVLTLDASQQAWIRYCYGFDLNFRYQREICRFVWENYLKQHEGVKFQKRVEKRLIQLVWLAVQDRAAKNRNELYKEYAGVALSRLLSVDRSGWIRIYSSHWKGLKRACKIMDDNALSLVYSKINSDTEETPMG
ncbi:MAG: bacteriophage antitermination protein Q [Enterobacter sp.]|nr:bacteriophage antitermination protein Q [Enterobacter sp.]